MTEAEFYPRALRLLDRIAVALEQSVLLKVHGPGTTGLARLRVALLRAETPAQVATLWRRASEDLSRRERAEAGRYVIERLVYVGQGTKGLETSDAAKTWLAAQVKVTDLEQPGQPTAKPSAGGGRSGR